MKFKCKRTELHEAITNVSKTVPAKSNIPALEGIKLDVNGNSLELTGYDLELGIKTSIPIESEDKGSLIVNARLFGEIIRRMSSDELEITIDEKLNVTISGDLTQYDISAIPADEYPDFPAIESEKSVDIPQYILKNMIDHTNHAVSTNENKPILTGELFDIKDGNFNMVAIDGYRLAVRSEKLIHDDNFYFVVPSKALNEVSRLLSKSEQPKTDSQNAEDIVNEELCSVFTDNKHIIFKISGYNIISRLLEGEFHNYKASISPECKTEVIVKTKELADSIERCSLLISEKNRSPVRCLFKNGTIHIDCKTTVGKINDKVNAEISGEELEIGFNNKYLSDALKSCDTDKIKIQLLASNKPIKIVPVSGDSFLFLLMPIQLKK